MTETGNKEYWYCKDCRKYFADENGENEIKLADTEIAKLPPAIIEGAGQSLTAGELKELVFRSNAAFSDFIRVEVDGQTLDSANYTTREGSIIVTLKAGYVATLPAGGHTLGIVSATGTASTTFTVYAPAANTQNPAPAQSGSLESPPTRDDSNIGVWAVVLLVSVGLLIVTGVLVKKKRFEE